MYDSQNIFCLGVVHISKNFHCPVFACDETNPSLLLPTNANHLDLNVFTK